MKPWRVASGIDAIQAICAADLADNRHGFIRVCHVYAADRPWQHDKGQDENNGRDDKELDEGVAFHTVSLSNNSMQNLVFRI